MPYWAYACPQTGITVDPAHTTDCRCSPLHKAPCSGAVELTGNPPGGWNTLNDCLLFLRRQQQFLCFCPPPKMSKQFGRFLFDDEGDSGSGQVLQVYGFTCCAIGMLANISLQIGRTVWADEGDPGSGDIRDVIEADVQCQSNQVATDFTAVYGVGPLTVTYPARALWPDEEKSGSGHIREIYVIPPSCKNFCCFCGSAPQGIRQGCAVPMMLCLHLAGTDVGRVPLFWSSVPCNNVAPCACGGDVGPFCGGGSNQPCFWWGRFHSVLGIDVWVALCESCGAGGPPGWGLWFLFPCPNCRDQFHCQNPPGPLSGHCCTNCQYAISNCGSFNTNDVPCPPGMSLGPFTCQSQTCNSLPGARWGGRVSEPDLIDWFGNPACCCSPPPYPCPEMEPMPPARCPHP